MKDGIIRNPILGDLGNISGESFIQRFVSMAISFAFVAGAVIFFFMLLIGGVQWISSGGDKQAVEAARGRVTNAFIGILILFGSYVIIKLVGTIFGIENLLILDIGGLKI